MPSTRNLRVQNVFTLGSLPPTLGCPHCPRHFRSTGGRTKHIRAKHEMDGSLPPDPNPSAPPPSVLESESSESQLSPGLSSPIPSNAESTTPSLHGGFDPQANWGVEQPHSDFGYASPGPDSDAANEDPLPASS